MDTKKKEKCYNFCYLGPESRTVEKLASLLQSDGPDVEEMTSKIILMMPKNQELSKFQRIRSQKASRIKFQRFKIQRIKIQE